MGNLEKLKILYNEALLREKNMIEKGKKPNMLEYTYAGLTNANGIFMMASLYIDPNLQKFRVSTSIIGKIRYMRIIQEANEKPKEERKTLLQFSSTQIGYAILSDNEQLIQAYGNYDRLGNDVDTYRYNLVSLYQKLIKKDFLDLQKEYDFFIEATKIEYARKLGIVYIIEGFQNGDESKIKDGILSLLYNQEDSGNGIDNYFSKDALVFAKLAVRAGYSIRIEHELLPLEVLPIKPLDEYPQYWFLDEFDKEVGWKQ